MKIFVPRFVDKENLNAQNINAKAMLSQWFRSDLTFISVRFTNNVPSEILHHKSYKLWSGRIWPWQMIFRYLQLYDHIFYPGHEWYDALALRLRRYFRSRTPVTATLEAVPWMTPDLKVDLEDICGHKIYTLSYEASKHYSHVLGMADHIIAISPFLSLVGRHLYGNKISVLSLGVDCETFFVDDNTAKAERITVICAATAYDHKRPWLFVELAAANPDCDFIWYGVSRGATMSQVHNKIKGLGLTNINFKAPISHAQLAHEFRKAHLFVLPSMSEGVPKAAQEAAACGLPLILFGQYEAPTVVHGENGYVVWDDQEFLSTVSSAVQNKERLHKMSKKSAEMAKEWSWSRLAPLWQKEILAEI